MDSLGEETWDAVICGTGLQQSLLALALSRSNKRVLHLDPNDYYGEHEAAFSLQEAETWAAAHAENATAVAPAAGHGGLDSGNAAEEPKASSTGSEGEGTSHGEKPLGSEKTTADKSSLFINASVWKHPDAAARGLSFPRAYSLPLAPQIIHTRSKLLAQLVSSRAYRQVEFLAVGSFFVYDASASDSQAKLSRIPSSREDVFATRSIPARSKRSLIKFLKFVLDYDSEEQRPVWHELAEERLAEFLDTEFKLDANLRKYVLALTLTLDGHVTVKDGLATINRHLTSMGLFGPGFCAVYPKWGGTSEVAQVACRAGAVGGGIYMLDTRMNVNDTIADVNEISLNLSNGISVRATNLVTSQQEAAADSTTITRLVAVVDSPLPSLFEIIVEGAPTPAVAVIAFPSGSLPGIVEFNLDVPIYAFVHSSETGECPAGQSAIYLTTLSTPQATQRLAAALDALLKAVAAGSAEPATCLYKLQYEQSLSTRESLRTTRGKSSTFKFPSPSLSLALDDTGLDAVKDAWSLIMGDDADSDDTEYMVFQDREGVGDDNDDVYD
ncbi:Uu.00g113690.m01.CDS01 [Anthostomella pinea]|uniref:Rab proteins geranylgeranyltransferase n=1 Tax=Anthostomella pinea TaxID=933095 RepID=A0AAI8YGH1_9PEZI|nr:Uu.00g113690.m01.CDS01 [Anthostomella pinea]